MYKKPIENLRNNFFISKWWIDKSRKVKTSTFVQNIILMHLYSISQHNFFYNNDKLNWKRDVSWRFFSTSNFSSKLNVLRNSYYYWIIAMQCRCIASDVT